MRYVVATRDGLTVGAVGTAPDRAGSPRWNTYMSVADADEPSSGDGVRRR